jgi:16S rRNA (cytidine1402-2'-O)-methyltransferase
MALRSPASAGLRYLQPLPGVNATPGTLYLVATPIGNLEDLSPRAQRVLREVDLIAAEDTRHTRILLDRYSIRTPLLSFHQHNERARTDELIIRLRAGESVALVSDAGMPLVSDAGALLVQRVQAAQLSYTCIPGPSAVETALVLSGLPAGAYQFVGFVPRAGKARRALWTLIADSTCTTICFESPKRVLTTLADAAEHLPEREVVLARELTKIHEEILRGSVAELAVRLSEPDYVVRGECVLLFAPAAGETVSCDVKEARRWVAIVQETGNVSRSTAARIVAALTGVSRRELYTENDGNT